MTHGELLELFRLVARRDPDAAPQLHKLADKIRALAFQLEADAGMRSPGGMSDKVRMQVIGPDGQVKSDTGEEP